MLAEQWAAHLDQGGQSSLPANEGQSLHWDYNTQDRNSIGTGWDDLAEMLLGCVLPSEMAVFCFFVFNVSLLFHSN